ncbi:hypothetical protein ACP275_10G055200 [Erythranthe tilingii]
MANKKPRVVIVGAGMAGLTAANKLHTSTHLKQLFELTVVEGGSRIGGRINSSDFCGDRIEQGATWIHGIEGSPLYKIAQEQNLLHSHRPWECMIGIDSGNPATVAEGGHRLSPSIVHPISTLFKNLMNHMRGKSVAEDGDLISEIVKNCPDGENLSVGSFLRRGLEAYWGVSKDQKGVEGVGNWSRKSIEEAIFAMHENIQRGYSSADDLTVLDYNAEREYANAVFPGEEITVARGYSSVVESLASVLPLGTIQLNRKVEKIEWQQSHEIRPVKLHFSDGTSLSADHVIVTVSLGVLKNGIHMFDPPLPISKNRAISKLGFGVVNKVFLQLPPHDQETKSPFLQMVFRQPNSELRHPKIPDWIRKTSLLYPIYTNSSVWVSWITGKEALEIESLEEDEIAKGFSTTTTNLLSSNSNSGKPFEFVKAMRTQWGSDPLFFGSYSFVAVGSSGDDMDVLAEPLNPQLQIMFAGEATHRRLYSTTHGAYFSGLREANRLLDYYNYCH